MSDLRLARMASLGGTAALLLPGAPALRAADPPPGALREQLLPRVLEGRWQEVLPLAEQLTRRDPDYALGWLALGLARSHTGLHREAIPAFDRALALGAAQPFRIHLDLARVHAALGDPDAALDWLDRAVAAKAPSRQRWASDPRLKPLAGLPRFKALTLTAELPAATRAEGWRSDIDLLVGELKRLHARPFRQVPESVFDARIAALKAEVDKLDDGAITVRLMQILLPVADGHTQIVPPYRSGESTRLLPLQMFLFEEGLYVTAVPAEHADLLWARVDRIDRTPVAEAIRALGTVIPRDNDMWIKTRAPLFLRYPQILKPLGITAADDRATYTLVDRHGKARQVDLQLGRPSTAPLERPPEAPADPPRHLRQRRDPYWFEVLGPERTLYFQYNAVANRPGGQESLAQFADRLAQAIAREDIDRLVIDLRWNGGGNLELNLPLLKAILASPKVNRPRGLYVIVGRQTFSAAQVFAGHLERFSHATFVGEPTGSSPNFIGEHSDLKLPYSRLTVNISFLAWQTGAASDHRTWIAPSIPVPVTFAHWRSGQDAALEAILAQPH